MIDQEDINDWISKGAASMVTSEAKQATDPKELERQIMSATEPKNEREWWAAREIERLREAVLAERDACAKIAEGWRTNAPSWEPQGGYIAAAIRERPSP